MNIASAPLDADGVRELHLPLAEADVRSLKVGDQVCLTGPVTMLQWSFVRDDQPRAR